MKKFQLTKQFHLEQNEGFSFEVTETLITRN